MYLTLHARWKVVLASLIAAVGFMAVYSIIQSKVYIANAALVIDAKGPDPVTGASIPAQLIPGYITTQAEIIGSEQVAQRVAKMLNLSENLYYRQRFGSQAPSEMPFQQWIASYLLTKLTVNPSKESSVVALSFQAPTPDLAADILNSFIDAFRQTTIDMRVEPARQYMQWYDDQIRSMRQTLIAAQGKLSKFEQDNKIVARGDVNDIDAAQLNELSLQLANAKAEDAENLSKQERIKILLTSGKPVDSLPEVLTNQTIQNLKADLSREEKRLQEIASRFESAHPEYLRQQATVFRLKSSINAEISKIVGSIAERASVAKQRQEILERSIDEQKAIVLNKKKQRDELAVLSQEVRDAQRAYEDTLQRRSNVRLESQLTQANISVLNPAKRPTRHAQPNYVLNAILGLLGGFIIGTGLVFLLEAIDRRIRSAEDLSMEFSIPVLATFRFHQLQKSAENFQVLNESVK